MLVNLRNTQCPTSTTTGLSSLINIFINSLNFYFKVHVSPASICFFLKCFETQVLAGFKNNKWLANWCAVYWWLNELNGTTGSVWEVSLCDAARRRASWRLRQRVSAGPGASGTRGGGGAGSTVVGPPAPAKTAKAGWRGGNVGGAL